jgi:uncharacterized protein with von Willebrand factor type A (vWA) domain
MSPAFDAEDLERAYAFLDDCPDQFLQSIVTLPVGTLPERVQGLRAWREALLDGRLPPDTTWPPPEIAAPARTAIESLGIARFCKQQPDLVDALLRTILSSFAQHASSFLSEVAARLRELERLERSPLEKLQQRGAGRRNHNRQLARIDEATLDRLRRQAEQEVAQRPANADVELVAAWSEQTRAWADISEVFGDLGSMMGRGWDMSIGVLKHTGWMDLLRLRALLEQLPQLREIVRSLGQLHVSEADDPVAEKKLRYLWHARRAERALLTYRVEGIEIERRLVARDVEEAIEKKRPRPERGPIVAVIDTSGSMHGLPERVAKALVLEALRTAHAEKRRCVVYAYAGPGRIAEHELALTQEGVAQLLRFLGMTFGGGSDEAGVVARVVKRLEEQDWRKADVVFVSDGEWPAPVDLVREVEKARERGTRFHGVQIGNRGRTGLHSICAPVHVFQDWANIASR